MQNIVPLYYEMKKAQPVILNKDSIYQGMIKAYSTGNIGPYSNNISKIWNGEEVDEEQLNVIRWLCMENNYCIDMAKTLYMPTRPQEVNEIIKQYTKSKVPNFFIHAKDKTEEQVELPNASTMNKITSKIPDYKISYCDTIGDFDYKVLTSGKYNLTELQQKELVDVYDYWSKRRNSLFIHEANNHVNEKEMFVYQELRKRIIEETGKNIDYIVDGLVEYLYANRKASKKQVLWACFGKEIVENTKKNLANADPICPVCGKRFKPRDNANTKYCSNECYYKNEKERKRKLAAELRENKKVAETNSI